jgi:Rha family phage regulatory protein
MSKLILNPEYGLYERQGKPFCSSWQVAEEFNKGHRRVLQDIRELPCSENFRLHNFVQSSYLNEQHKKQPDYLMTKDGFIILVMGYTGNKAMAFKEAYIERFNLM